MGLELRIFKLIVYIYEILTDIYLVDYQRSQFYRIFFSYCYPIIPIDQQPNAIASGKL